MLNAKNGISRYQLLCLGFLALLSPIIRVLPRQAVFLSGSGAWVTAFITAVPVGLLFLLIQRFFKYSMPSEGLAELICRSLGKKLGKALIILICVWLILYAGFSLRSSAERYVTSAYQHSSPSFFNVVMLLLCTLAALGTFKTLARTAEAFFPLMFLVLALVFGFAFSDVDRLFLPPVTFQDTGKLLSGVPVVANVISLGVYVGFMEGQVLNKPARGKTMVIWLLSITVVVALLCITTVGSFGQLLTSELLYPFFVMIKNISIFNVIERMEAIVLSLWVITDFLLVSLLIFIVVGNFRFCLNYPAEKKENSKLWSMKDGRYLVWVCSGLILLAAQFIAPNTFALTKLSRYVVPVVNLCFTFGVLPLIIFIGLLRKRV